VAWTTGNVAGLKLEQRDPIKVEVLAFSADGHVAATYGTKDRPVTSPILYWTIVDGRLRVGDDTLREDLTLLGGTESTIKVRRKGGETAEYAILQK
jgi:hypothetical protein